MFKKFLRLFYWKYDTGIYRVYRILGIKITTKPSDLVVNSITNIPQNFYLYNEYNTIISTMQLLMNKPEYDLNCPVVSIIIPVYNIGRKYLTKSILSAVHQSLKNIEIIIINDCSKNPEDEETILEFSQNDQRIRYIKNDKNLGSLATRMKGVKEAKGYSIAFLDADDTLALNTLEITSSLLLKYNIEAVIYNFYFIKDEKISSNPISQIPTFLYKYDILERYCNYDLDSSMCNKLYKKDLLLKIIDDDFNNRNIYAEDIITNFKILSNANTLLYMPLHLYYVNRRENSITNSFNLKYIECVNIGIEEIFSYYIKNNLDLNKDYLNNLFAIYVKSLYIYIINSKKITKSELENINNLVKNLIYSNMEKKYLDKDAFIKACKKYNYYYLLKLIK